MEASIARPLAADVRRLLWHRPELPWALLACAAWLLVVLSHSLHPQARDVGDPASLPHWAGMTMATMLPATLPMLRDVAQRSLWRRRYSAPAGFVTGYLAVWLAFGAIAIALWSALGPHLSFEPETASAIVLAAGAPWSTNRWKARFLKGTHRELSLPARGLAAELACARYGAYHAGQCVGACWPLMLAMVPWHGWALMLGATAISSWERLARRPRLRRCAAAIGALAALTVLGGL